MQHSLILKGWMETELTEGSEGLRYGLRFHREKKRFGSCFALILCMGNRIWTCWGRPWSAFHLTDLLRFMTGDSFLQTSQPSCFQRHPEQPNSSSNSSCSSSFCFSKISNSESELWSSNSSRMRPFLFFPFLWVAFLGGSFFFWSAAFWNLLASLYTWIAPWRTMLWTEHTNNY